MASEEQPSEDRLDAEAEAVWAEPTDKEWEELLEVLPRPRADFLPDFPIRATKKPRPELRLNGAHWALMFGGMATGT